MSGPGRQVLYLRVRRRRAANQATARHQIPGGQRHDADDIADISLVHRQAVIAFTPYRRDSAQNTAIVTNGRHIGYGDHRFTDGGIAEAYYPAYSAAKMAPVDAMRADE